MNIVVRWCWRHIYFRARHVLGKHNGTVVVRPVSSAAFLLISPGSWQQLHLCPDAFITLAWRGRHITEGGWAPSAPWNRGQGRKAGKAPCTHPGPPMQGERGQVDQMAAHHKGPSHHVGGTCLEISSLRATCGCFMCLWYAERWGEVFGMCCTLRVRFSRPELGLWPRFLVQDARNASKVLLAWGKQEDKRTKL